MTGNCSFHTEKETSFRSCSRRLESMLYTFLQFYPPDFTCSISETTEQVLCVFFFINPWRTSRKRKVQHNNAATGDFGCLSTFSRACFGAGLVIKG